MTVLSHVFATVLAEQTYPMRIALITIASMAAVALLLLILISIRGKKGSE